jgi:hypothetical protein
MPAERLNRAIAALEEIRDSYWPDGQPQGEKVNALKEIAADALRHIDELAAQRQRDEP